MKRFDFSGNEFQENLDAIMDKLLIKKQLENEEREMEVQKQQRKRSLEGTCRKNPIFQKPSDELSELPNYMK